jgi:hypothetical protein
MAVSAVNGVVNYLLTTFATAAAAVDPLAIVAESRSQVTDAATIVLVGRGSLTEELAVSYELDWPRVGRQPPAMEETFTVHCVIWCQDLAVEDAGPVRMRAWNVMAGCLDAIRNDITLGGNLTQGRVGIGEKVEHTSTVDTLAGLGRTATITFGVLCVNIW